MVRRLAAHIYVISSQLPSRALSVVCQMGLVLYTPKETLQAARKADYKLSEGRDGLTHLHNPGTVCLAHSIAYYKWINQILPIAKSWGQENWEMCSRHIH